MIAESEHIAELYELAGAQCDGALTADRTARLEELVLGDVRLRRSYILYMHVHASAEKCDVEEKLDPQSYDSPLTTSLPSLSTTHYPLPTSFVGGPVFSYLVATVVLCLMILGAWAYTINHDHNLTADNSRRSTTSGSVKEPELVFVGRITGMKDCKWSDLDTQTVIGASVPLDREYALSSGLLEITHKSGARVILEGPCKYTVESTIGGFLERGKLTARLVHQGPTASAAGAKPQAVFAVKTPTAVVTDLGTEFGVEVDENGDTTSYVFEGAVKVQLVDAAGTPGDEIILSENESARVEKATVGGALRIVISDDVSFSQKFVRNIYETRKSIDLLDIVAGGNGLGRKRGSGIDPTSGMVDPVFLPGSRFTNRKYLPVMGHRMIDGVFVPSGGDGGVQLDSANHSFYGFPQTGGNAWGSIWAREAETKKSLRKTDGRFWVNAMDYDPRFMPDKRGLLIMHPNAGITFDLETMRRAHSVASITRFIANAGLVDAQSLFPENHNGQADLWIFVDGRLRMKRLKLRPEDGVVEIDEELGPNDRFLTIVTTDGGNGHSNDWVLFGDPVLMVSQKAAKSHPSNNEAMEK